MSDYWDLYLKNKGCPRCNAAAKHIKELEAVVEQRNGECSRNFKCLMELEDLESHHLENRDMLIKRGVKLQAVVDRLASLVKFTNPKPNLTGWWTRHDLLNEIRAMAKYAQQHATKDNDNE